MEAEIMRTRFYVLFILSAIPLGIVNGTAINLCHFRETCQIGCRMIGVDCKAQGGQPFLVQTDVNKSEILCFTDYSGQFRVGCEIMKQGFQALSL
jgi:hypothetical protein